MKEDRIHIKLEAINSQLFDLDIDLEESSSHKDAKEVKKRQSRLLKERRKLQRKLDNIQNNQ